MVFGHFKKQQKSPRVGVSRNQKLGTLVTPRTDHLFQRRRTRQDGIDPKTHCGTFKLFDQEFVEQSVLRRIKV